MTRLRSCPDSWGGSPHGDAGSIPDRSTLGSTVEPTIHQPKEQPLMSTNVPSFSPEKYAAEHTHLDRATGRPATAYTPPEDRVPVVDMTPFLWDYVTLTVRTLSGAHYTVVKRRSATTIVKESSLADGGFTMRGTHLDIVNGQMHLFDGDRLIARSTVVVYTYVLEN
jgi:hypothetical protein